LDYPRAWKRGCIHTSGKWSIIHYSVTNEHANDICLFFHHASGNLFRFRRKFRLRLFKDNLVLRNLKRIQFLGISVQGCSLKERRLILFKPTPTVIAEPLVCLPSAGKDRLGYPFNNVNSFSKSTYQQIVDTNCSNTNCPKQGVPTLCGTNLGKKRKKPLPKSYDLFLELCFHKDLR